MAQRTRLNRPYGLQHEDDVVRDITELYEGQTSIYNIIEGLVNVASNGAITGFFNQNDYGDDLTVESSGGYLIYNKPGGFSENTTVQITIGYEFGGDTINYTWGGYRWTDGKVYIWASEDGALKVNGILLNTSVLIKELI